MKARTLQEWQEAYRRGVWQPRAAMAAWQAAQAQADAAWIYRVDPQALQAAAEAVEARLQAAGGDYAQLPLYGVPFAVKDNIDVAGLPTTAACPAFSYVARETAPAVQRLLDAGALLVGKTNLDQFATGLAGVRSPYGAVPNPFKADYISGGSSSGSASLVARGIVPFALGTDTAGSGRVPAGFCNIVGLKPTRGWFSTRGVVPACRTLDCVSVFALTAADATTVAVQLGVYDAGDAYARRAPVMAAPPPLRRLGVAAAPQWFGDGAAAAAYAAALTRLEALGVSLVPLDFAVLHETAALLYQGPWVAERYAAIEDFIAAQAQAVHPVVREIVLRGRAFSAVEVFKAEYRRAALKRAADALMAEVDALLVPTTPTIYTLAELAEEPIARNSVLGTYTDFVNLLDWSALAMPAGFRSDGLPFGLTLIGPAWQDLRLGAFAQRWQAAQALPLGATARSAAPPLPVDTTAPVLPPLPPVADGHLRLAVVGAHLRGMPLNHELSDRGAQFVAATTTAPRYRLYALRGTVPPKPGLARADTGMAIQLELWDLPLAAFGSFVAGVPAPLGIGSLELADGRWVQGFICEPWALQDAEDISHYGGWRAFRAAAASGASGAAPTGTSS